MKIFLVFTMILLAAGCSSEDTVAPGPSSTTGAESQRAESSVTIAPENATARSVITLQTDTSLLNGATIDWYVNGNVAESAGGPCYESNDLSKGDIVQAVITSGKKKHSSNEIRIVNTPPEVKKAALVPALPRTGATINVRTEAFDVDGDTIFYKYRWSLNGEYISDQSFLNAEFRRDDIILAEITPYDREDAGKTIFAKSKIYNSLPVLGESSPAFDGQTYTYHIKAVDPDKDDLTYEIKDGPEGMTVDRKGLITWKPQPADAGTHKYTLIISDNKGGELVIPVTTTIGYE